MKYLSLIVFLLLAAVLPTSADPWIILLARNDIGKTASDLGLRRNTLWCSAYLDYRTGRNIGDRAMEWLKRPKTNPSIGTIAVMKRGKNGGHAGIVSGFDSKNNPIIISGNHNGVVGEGVYPRQRIMAYVLP